MLELNAIIHPTGLGHLVASVDAALIDVYAGNAATRSLRHENGWPTGAASHVKHICGGIQVEPMKEFAEFIRCEPAELAYILAVGFPSYPCQYVLLKITVSRVEDGTFLLFAVLIRELLLATVHTSPPHRSWAIIFLP